jgi:hypothetical protein
MPAMKRRDLITAFLGVGVGGAAAQQGDVSNLARRMRPIHRFSTWFYVHNVRDLLSTGAGMAAALAWCRETGITKAYIESFRDGYQVEAALLEKVKRRFDRAGIETAGGITPTEFGKRSSGWRGATCYTDPASQDKFQAMVDHCVSVFDSVLVDDFFFTDCKCPECDAARASKTVRVAGKKYPVAGDSWPEYRSELMMQVLCSAISRSRAVKSRARIELKYPTWYEIMYERGYDLPRQIPEVARVVLGTETRDLDKGGVLPYHAYFSMRWLHGLAGSKCGGGWYDWLSTTPATFVEQARQVVLAGEEESCICCYGGLIYDRVSMPCCFDGVKQKHGPADVAALRRHMPELFEVAREVRARQPRGIATYFNLRGSGNGDKQLFDVAGTLGLPLLPCHEFPTRAPAAFFTAHLLAEPDWAAKLDAFIRSGRPVLLSGTLAKAAAGHADVSATNVALLPSELNAKSLWTLPQETVDEIRKLLLQPLGAILRCPAGVAFYPFEDGSWVLENFQDRPAIAELNGRQVDVPARGWVYEWNRSGGRSAQP